MRAAAAAGREGDVVEEAGEAGFGRTKIAVKGVDLSGLGRTKMEGRRRTVEEAVAGEAVGGEGASGVTSFGSG
jgi:hypothetical protein